MLLDRINELKRLLNLSILETEDLKNDKILKLSQELDELIVKYYRYSKQTKTSIYGIKNKERNLKAVEDHVEMV